LLLLHRFGRFSAHGARMSRRFMESPCSCVGPALCEFPSRAIAASSFFLLRVRGSAGTVRVVLRAQASALHCRRTMLRPNNSFKPKPLRYSKNVAKKACHAFASTTRFGLTQALGLMSRVRLTVQTALGYALVVAIAVGVVAWNTREKCLAGVGLLSQFSSGCPSPKTLVVAVAILSAAVFVWAALRAMRNSHDVAERSESSDEA